MTALSDYLDRQNIVDKFATYADRHGLQRRNLLIQKSHKLLERYLDSRIIYNMLDEEAWNQYLNQNDPVITKTLEVFKTNSAFPKKPELKTPTSKSKKTAFVKHEATPQGHTTSERIRTLYA